MREVLIAGAARAFAELGLRACTMQAVAAAAGVSKATLYNHFRSKEELARVLLAAELDRLTALAGALPPELALAALGDELGGHPVLRRLAATEAETLATLLDVPSQTWDSVTTRLAAALGTDEEGAGLAARWLLGVVLQPGLPSVRRRSAVRLAQCLAAG